MIEGFKFLDWHYTDLLQPAAANMRAAMQGEIKQGKSAFPTGLPPLGNRLIPHTTANRGGQETTAETI